VPGPASTTAPQKVWKVLCVIPHCSCQRRVSSLSELFVAMTVLGQSLPITKPHYAAIPTGRARKRQ
jgi:hypothetical protein